MIQTVFVIILIALAAFYLGMRGYSAWKGKKQKGCEKCGPADKSL